MLGDINIGEPGALIGFAGAPWTIFSYMLEGSGSKTFSKARKFLYQNPKAAHLLLDKITVDVLPNLSDKTTPTW